MNSDHTSPLGAAIVRRHLAFATRGAMLRRARHAAAFASRHSSFVNRVLRRWSLESVGEEFSAVWPVEFDDQAMWSDRSRVAVLRSTPSDCVEAPRYRVTPDRALASSAGPGAGQSRQLDLTLVPSKVSSDGIGNARPIVSAQRSTERAGEGTAANRSLESHGPLQRDVPAVRPPTAADQAMRVRPAGAMRSPITPSHADAPSARPVVTPAAASASEMPPMAHPLDSRGVVRPKRIAGAIPAIRALSRSERTPGNAPSPDRRKPVGERESDRPIAVESMGNTPAQQPLPQRPIVRARAASKAAAPAIDPVTDLSPSLVHPRESMNGSADRPHGAGGQNVQAAGRVIGEVARRSVTTAERGVMRMRRSAAAPATSGFGSTARIHRFTSALRAPIERNAPRSSGAVMPTGAIPQIPTPQPAIAGSPPAPARPADSKTTSSPQLAGMTLDEIVEHAVRRLARQVAIEAERRGVSSWRSRS